MKKTLLLTSLLLISLCSSYAQTNANTTPRVLLGNMPGKVSPPLTREELLKNTTLVVEGSSCKIISFMFSIMPDGHDFIGPFTITGSNEFSPQIKKILAGLDNSGGRVFIENIRLNCGGEEKVAQSLVFKYK